MMLTDAAFLLLAAAALGTLLAVVQLQRPTRPPIPWVVGLLHGAIGTVGVVLTLLAPARASAAQAGAGPFKQIAVVALALAFLFGLWIFRARVAARPLSFGVVGVHAMFAITGVVLLGAYLAAG